MPQQVPLGDDARAGVVRDDGTHEVAQDLAYRRTIFVNVAFFGLPGSSRWVLIDTGLQGSSGVIEKTITERFGPDSRPAAIVLTHGHFDHVGSLEHFASKWGVPVYAHPLEFPYLDGRAAYPDPDPGVGGGLMARSSPFFPKGPVDVSRWLNPLPEDGTVPGMPGWRWLHTPGHTPGHVSFWRPEDRTLLAGDAFITTATESAYAAVDTIARDARSAEILHAELGAGACVGADAGRAATRDRPHRSRSRDARSRHAPRARDAGA